MDDEQDKEQLIKSNKIFSMLDQPTLAKLIPRFEKIDLIAGTTLFYQGDPASHIYLLASGKLSRFFVTANGDKRFIGHVEPGEIVGETGVLLHEPRSFTIDAVRDSTLLRLSSKDFLDLCQLQPQILFESIHPIVTRSRNIYDLLSAQKTYKYVVLVAANPEIDIHAFAEKLLTLIHTHASVIPISEFDYTFGREHLDEEALKEKIHLLEKYRRGSQRIVVVLKSADSPLAKIMLKKADLLYLIGDSQTSPRIHPILLERIATRAKQFKTDPDLILLHSSHITPYHTSAWLSKTNIRLVHHVRVEILKDFTRLLRFIRGKAVGVVLSGGGTRGWAHLGGIKAIREAKIPIDIIGGTSVGAIVAACYAMNESYEDAYDRFHRVISTSKGSVSWKNLTWPVISIFNAKNFTISQVEAFQQTYIEDLRLPFFCISCNLANSAEEVHRNGLLWERTRASSAIPGVIPPMLLDGELHLDGGLLNNLPVDVMRSFIGPRAKIIALELNSFAPDKHKYQFPPILTFFKTLLAKIGFARDKYKFPRFIDTFMRSITIGSMAKSRKNSLAATVFVNLTLEKFRLLHVNEKQSERLFEIGYEETKSQLQKAKEQKATSVQRATAGDHR